MAKAPGRLIDTNEVAERLGVTRQHVSALIRDKKIPAKKLGQIWVIDSNDLASVKDRPKRGRPRKKKSDDDEEDE